MSSDDIEAALNNLQAIKQGDDPTASEEPGSGAASETQEPDSTASNDWLELARNEVDRLYEEHDLGKHLDRQRLHVAVTEWTRKNGVCKYHRRLDGKARFGKRMSSLPRSTGEHVIAINKTLSDQKAFLDTVRHELAHAIVYEIYGKSQKHNSNWKEMARRLGADDSACHTKDKNHDDHNYYLVCTECNEEWGRTRRSKTIKKPHMYLCGNCNERALASYEAGCDRPTEPHVTRFDE